LSSIAVKTAIAVVAATKVAFPPFLSPRRLARAAYSSTHRLLFHMPDGKMPTGHWQYNGMIQQAMPSPPSIGLITANFADRRELLNRQFVS
jgi:hypothetical protein